MHTKFKDIRIIGWLLAILYGTSLAVYLQSFSTTLITQISVRPVILSFLLTVLLIGSIAVIQLKEWGRTLLIFCNAIMGIYLVSPYILKDLIPVSFSFMNIIIILFFSQRQIYIYFRHVRVNISNGQWKSILVIDDDEALLKTLRPILMTHGYSVLTANSGEEGLQVARAQKPDLIILDVILPGIKGREVCKILKTDPVTKNIPVIFLTVKDSEDEIRAEKEVGAASHVTKPVRIKPLILTIQDVLKSSSVS